MTAVASATGTYGVTYDTTAVPRAAAFGATFNATLRVTNTSSFAWPAAGPGSVQVGYRWLDATGRVVVPDGVRTGLPADVPIGATATVVAQVVAPGAIGSYLLRFEFDLPESVLLVILQMNPPGAMHHTPDDYEFLPGSHTLLNQHMTNMHVVPVP